MTILTTLISAKSFLVFNSQQFRSPSYFFSYHLYLHSCTQIHRGSLIVFSNKSKNVLVNVVVSQRMVALIATYITKWVKTQRSQSPNSKLWITTGNVGFIEGEIRMTERNGPPYASIFGFIKQWTHYHVLWLHHSHFSKSANAFTFLATIHSLFSLFFFFLLSFHLLLLFKSLSEQEKENKDTIFEIQEIQSWLEERSRSRGLRTLPTGRSLTLRDVTVFSRKLMSSQFFVMLRFLLSCFLALASSMNTLALPLRMFLWSKP